MRIISSSGFVRFGLAATLVACAGETSNPNPYMSTDQTGAAGNSSSTTAGNATDTTTNGSTSTTGSGTTAGGSGTTAGVAITGSGGSMTIVDDDGTTAGDMGNDTAAANAGAPGSTGSGGSTGGTNLTTGGTTTGMGMGGSAAMAGAAPTSMGGTSSGGATSLGGASSAGATSTGAGGSAASVDSSGCGAALDQPTGEWVQEPNVTIEGTPREWFTWLPDNYDPERAYPLVVLLHGCTGANNNVPVQNQSGDDAILVRGTGIAANTCWDASANGPNLDFFDAMVDGTAAKSCVDQNRIFAAGYSSGSWLISVLNCLRADRLRAVGTVAGGDSLFGNQQCNGNVAAIFIHDQDDTENQWSGHESAMERVLENNGCTMDTVPEDPDPCVRYQGCGDNPVKFCPTTGQGHNRQDQYASQAFWNFFSEF